MGWWRSVVERSGVTMATGLTGTCELPHLLHTVVAALGNQQVEPPWPSFNKGDPARVSTAKVKLQGTRALLPQFVPGHAAASTCTAATSGEGAAGGRVA
jgi:hypothetical protein